jgi:hypothetical protein
LNCLAVSQALAVFTMMSLIFIGTYQQALLLGVTMILIVLRGSGVSVFMLTGVSMPRGPCEPCMHGFLPKDSKILELI